LLVPPASRRASPPTIWRLHRRSCGKSNAIRVPLRLCISSTKRAQHGRSLRSRRARRAPALADRVRGFPREHRVSRHARPARFPCLRLGGRFQARYGPRLADANSPRQRQAPASRCWSTSPPCSPPASRCPRMPIGRGPSFRSRTRESSRPYQNATGRQVTSAVLVGIVWMLDNPDRGIVEADEMDFRRCLSIQRTVSGASGRSLHRLDAACGSQSLVPGIGRQ
jgi:hypothetical protein